MFLFSLFYRCAESSFIYIVIMACKTLMIKCYERLDQFLSQRGQRDINEKG